MVPSTRTIQWIKQLAAVDMMAIEAIVASVYVQRCESMRGYALFDGGAHRGYHTLKMGALVGCELVYAIEADPSMVVSLRGVLKDNLKDKVVTRLRGGTPPAYRLVTKALQQDPNRESVIWKSSTSHIGRSSISSTTGEGKTIWGANSEIEYREDQVIPATTIDQILSDEDRPIPFIKLDLEGADLVSLMGAEETLRKKRPIVAFENSVHAPKVHGFVLDEFISYLDNIDYVAVDFLGNRLGENNWFSFFEACLAPTEEFGWLAAALHKAVEEQAGKVSTLGESGQEKEPNKNVGQKGLTAVKSDPVSLVLDADLTERMQKNLSTDLYYGSSITTAAPEETRTVGWYELTADIAEAFWVHPSRLKQRVERLSAEGNWEREAEKYCSRIRAILRFLLKEDLSFRQLDRMPKPHQKTRQWMLDSGRLAWLMWLDSQRQVHARDEAEEKNLWEQEASDYRDFVRDCLYILRSSAIVFAE